MSIHNVLYYYSIKMASNTNRVAIVVGGNKGLGYEQVKQLAQSHPDWTIMLGARSAENAQTAIAKMKSEDSQHSFENVHYIQIEVTDSASIKAAVETMKHRGDGMIDYFIFNAAIALSKTDYDTIMTVLNVNLYGVRNTIEAFLPLIRPSSTGAKLIIVSSEVGAWTLNQVEEPLHSELLNGAPTMSWEHIESIIADYLAGVRQRDAGQPLTTKYKWPEHAKTFGAYGTSKLFLNAYSRMLATQRPDLHIALVCPGYCATDLNNFSGPRPASVGGKSVIFPVDHQTKSGHFYQDGNELPFSYSVASDHPASKILNK